jgi:hypothetical protein
MSRTIVLIIILFFVWWSLYNLYTSEGFQGSPSGSPSGSASGSASGETKCDKPLEIYKEILIKYNDAVTNNNAPLIEKLSPSLNSFKDMLTKMKCVIPTSV